MIVSSNLCSGLSISTTQECVVAQCDPCIGYNCNSGTCSSQTSSAGTLVPYCVCPSTSAGDRCQWRWAVGNWSQCSASCGDGTQQRVVKCVSANAISTQPLVDCGSLAVPASIQTCSSGVPCTTDPCVGVSCGQFGVCQNGVCSCAVRFA